MIILPGEKDNSLIVITTFKISSTSKHENMNTIAITLSNIITYAFALDKLNLNVFQPCFPIFKSCYCNHSIEMAVLMQDKVHVKDQNHWITEKSYPKLK